MTARTSLLALALLAAGVPFSPAQGVPKKWVKVADGKARAGVLFVRGDYTLWIDREVVPGTERNRAPSFANTIFRLKAGGKPVPLPGGIGTHAEDAVLGPRGEVVTGGFGHHNTVFLPDQPPVKLPPGVEYQALRFTPDGLLCFAYRYNKGRAKDQGGYEGMVLLFPIVDGKAQVVGPRVLRPWFATDYTRISHDFLHTNVFLSGDYLVHAQTRTDGKDKKFRQHHGTVAWEIKANRVAWEAPGVPSAVDDRFAYFLGDREVVRRPLAGKGGPERLPLPELPGVIDFQPPKLLALVHHDRRWIATRLDLTTGDRVEYALEGETGRPVAGGGGPGRLHRPFYISRFSGGVGSAPVSGDAKTGELRAAVGGAIYRVPVERKVAATERPRWVPVAE